MRYLTVKQFAEMFQISPNAVYARIRDKSITARDVARSGKKRPTWRIPASEAEEYEKNRNREEDSHDEQS